MKLPVKYFLLFFLLGVTYENSHGINSLNAHHLKCPETVTHEPALKLLYFQNANNSNLSHGEKIETNLIPSPLSFDNGVRFFYRCIQILVNKQKENSTNSYIFVFESKNLNRQSLSEILRI